MSQHRRLYAAAERGCEEDVREILEKGGVDVDRRTRGLSAFAAACIGKHIGIMRLLLEAGAKPRQVFKWFDGRWTTAAREACRLSNLEMLKLMFEFGVSAKKDAALLVEAARPQNKDSKDVVRFLLDQEASVGASVAKGETALHAASAGGSVGCVQVLLEAGASTSMKNVKGRTPLHVAFKDNNDAVIVDLFRLFLRFGADINSQGHQRHTPLYLAAKLGLVETTRFLLLPEHRALLDARSLTGWTALHAAVAAIQLDTARLLLDAGAGVNVRRSDGVTPLHLACMRNNAAMCGMIELLLQRGADATLLTTRGVPRTPLSIAVRHSKGRAEVTRALLQGGSDPAGQELLYAAEEGYPAVAEALLDAGADANVRCGRTGRTPLVKSVYAYRIRNDGEEKELRFIELLEARGADVNLADNNGNVALHAAVTRNSPRVVRLLLQLGADADATNDVGQTPFLLAQTRGREEVMTELLNHQSSRLPTDE